jgi:hypothetical protein
MHEIGGFSNQSLPSTEAPSQSRYVTATPFSVFNRRKATVKKS